MTEEQGLGRSSALASTAVILSLCSPRLRAMAAWRRWQDSRGAERARRERFRRHWWKRREMALPEQRRRRGRLSRGAGSGGHGASWGGGSGRGGGGSDGNIEVHLFLIVLCHLQHGGGWVSDGRVLYEGDHIVRSVAWGACAFDSIRIVLACHQ